MFIYCALHAYQTQLKVVSRRTNIYIKYGEDHHYVIENHKYAM